MIKTLAYDSINVNVLLPHWDDSCPKHVPKRLYYTTYTQEPYPSGYKPSPPPPPETLRYTERVYEYG